MQCDGADDADVRHRMAIAQTTFGSLCSIYMDIQHMAKVHEIGSSSIKKCLLLGISTRFS